MKLTHLHLPLQHFFTTPVIVDSESKIKDIKTGKYVQTTNHSIG